MQILSKEKDIFELRIDHLEDLWSLSQFIVQGDIIYSSTKRKVAIGNDKTKQIIKIIFVELKVQKTNFETDILRIQGDILNETEFTSIGQSHTLSFKINDTIKIKKNKLLKFEENLLEKAINSKYSLSLGLLLDKDELILFEFSENNFKILLHERNLGSKKGYSNIQINEEDEKFKLIEPILKNNYSNIILSGPGNFKEKLKVFLQNKGFKVITQQFYDVSPILVQKLIKKIFESGILVESQISREQEFLDEVLKRIGKSFERVSYGFKNVVNQINMGSVEKLLISTKTLNKYKEENNFTEIQDLFLTLEQTQGEVIIVNSKHEPGFILDGLGGIACLQRY